MRNCPDKKKLLYFVGHLRKFLLLIVFVFDDFSLGKQLVRRSLESMPDCNCWIHVP
jgi:hypothetical protein